MLGDVLFICHLIDEAVLGEELVPGEFFDGMREGGGQHAVIE